MEKLYTVNKTRPEADCAKFRLKLKKVGKTTRPFSSVLFSSFLQSCPTLFNPMNRSMPGLPVHHQLLEFTQIHVHQVGDAIQPSHPLSPLFLLPQSLPASESFPMSQLFTWGGQSTGVSALTSFLPKNTQDWSPLGWTGWISLQSKGLSRVFSNTTVQKHQFFSTQLSLQSNSLIHTWLWRKLSAKELMLLNYGVGEDSWESLGLQGDPTSPS